jgi:hypothetical protein
MAANSDVIPLTPLPRGAPEYIFIKFIFDNLSVYLASLLVDFHDEVFPLEIAVIDKYN